MFEVNERNSETIDKHDNNLMLFHGTTSRNACGILQCGYKNSEYGYFWAGVYNTDLMHMAIEYSERQADIAWKAGYCESKQFVFVNEVLDSEDLKTYVFSNYTRRNETEEPPKFPFTKYVHVNSPKPTLNDYKRDEKERKYRSAATSKWSQVDEFVADSSLVKPRYMIKLKAKENEENMDRFLDFFDENM